MISGWVQVVSGGIRWFWVGSDGFGWFHVLSITIGWYGLRLGLHIVSFAFSGKFQSLGD